MNKVPPCIHTCSYCLTRQECKFNLAKAIKISGKFNLAKAIKISGKFNLTKAIKVGGKFNLMKAIKVEKYGA